MSRIAVLSLYLLSMLLSVTILARPASADTVRYEEFSPSVTYDSNWELHENSGLSGGALISSDVAGAKVTINFTGTGISWVSYACTCAAGVGRVYLDGQVHGTATAYNTTRTPQATIYRIENLPNAPHVLTIEVTGGTATFSGEEPTVAFDAFDVIEPGTTVIQEHAPAVSYEGSWTDFADPTTSGGNVAGANTAGAAAVVNFTGAAISWIGYQCPCSSGVSRVLVDGVVVNDRVFVNSTERVPQKEHYRVSGLTYGPHTLRIELTGETVGDGPWVLIDAFHAMSSSNGPDTEKPVITLTSPTQEDILHGTITLSADASDNVGVAFVRFYVSAGNGSGLVGEDTTPPYSITWDSTTIPNTTEAYVVAQAFDATGNVGSSGGLGVPIQQEDYIRPTAALTQPVAGATLSGTINVAATASDNVGVATVFFRTSARSGGNVPFASDTTAPYETTLDTLPLLNGVSKFSVHARDLVDTPSHYRGTEVPVMVTIDNSLAAGRIRVDDKDTGIVYGGSWTTLQEIEDFRVYEWNTAHAADQAGATATFTFNGTGVHWRSLRCNVCGLADVSIDGGSAFRVNLTGTSQFAHPDQARSGVVFESPALANGSHTITITTVTSGQWVLVDAFDVLQP